MKVFLIILGVILVIILLGVGLFRRFSPIAIPISGPNQNNATQGGQIQQNSNPVLVQNLEVPWSLAFLPNGEILFTERKGEVRLIKNGQLQEQPVSVIDDVKQIGEGGLLGIVAHPKFTENKYIYVYYTFSGSGQNTLNRVVRYKYDSGKLIDRTIIVDNIPGNSNHNGGRIKFGPDGYLYITTGDAQEPSLAQNKNSLAGKILRVTDEGKIPNDNPFGNQVYSYGHRNPQGIVWDDQGRLWETEHGPSGVYPNCCQDELNLIQKGGNYGWPGSVGDKVVAGTIGPILHSGRDIWAPSGMIFYNGSVYFAGLRGNAIYQVNVNGTPQLQTHFKNKYGRIRTIESAPDGSFYITTNNRDGRGVPRIGDDVILQITPEFLNSN